MPCDCPVIFILCLAPADTRAADLTTILGLSTARFPSLNLLQRPEGAAIGVSVACRAHLVGCPADLATHPSVVPFPFPKAEPQITWQACKQEACSAILIAVYRGLNTLLTFSSQG